MIMVNLMKMINSTFIVNHFYGWNYYLQNANSREVFCNCIPEFHFGNASILKSNYVSNAIHLQISM